MNSAIPATVAPLASPNYTPARGPRTTQAGSGNDTSGSDAKFELPAAAPGAHDGSGTKAQSSGTGGQNPGKASHRHHADDGGSAASGTAVPVPALMPVSDPRNGRTTDQDATAGALSKLNHRGATAPVALPVHAFPIDDAAKPSSGPGAVATGPQATRGAAASASAASAQNGPAAAVDLSPARSSAVPDAAAAVQQAAVGAAGDHGVASILMQIGGGASKPVPVGAAKGGRGDAGAVQAAAASPDSPVPQVTGGAAAGSSDADAGAGGDNDADGSQDTAGGKLSTLPGGTNGPSVPTVLLQAAAANAGSTQSTAPVPTDPFGQVLGAVAGGLVHAGASAQPANTAPSSWSSAAQSGPLDTTQSGWTDALGGRVQWVLHQGLQEARIDLHPSGMGDIQVHVRVGAEGADVRFSATNPDVRQQLESSLPRLRDMLASGGLQLSQAQVGAQMQQDSAPGFTPRQATPQRGRESAVVDSAAPVETQRLRVASLSLIDDYA